MMVLYFALCNATGESLNMTTGLFLGSSSAVNCVAAVRLAKALGPGHTIVTLLADSGLRHLTKFWNDDKMQKAGNDVNAPFVFDV